MKPPTGSGPCESRQPATKSVSPNAQMPGNGQNAQRMQQILQNGGQISPEMRERIRRTGLRALVFAATLCTATAAHATFRYGDIQISGNLEQQTLIRAYRLG